MALRKVALLARHISKKEKNMFSAQEILLSLEDLPLESQIAVLEGLSADFAIAEIVDVLALCLMTVGLGVDSSCPDQLRKRYEALASIVTQFNESRFGPGHKD